MDYDLSASKIKPNYMQKKAAFDASTPGRLTNDEIHDLADKALKYIPERVAYFAKQIGVSYGGITIRNQKTKLIIIRSCVRM